jgi:hypothetical protein
MRKKTSVDFHGSDELSRLLTRERLHRAGVRTFAKPTADPDLDAILQRVRSSTVKTDDGAPQIRKDVVRKLVGG